MLNNLESYIELLVSLKSQIEPEAYEQLIRSAVTLEKENRLFTIADVMERLGISRSTVSKWVNVGTLPSVRLPGGQVRIQEFDLEAFIEKYRTETFEHMMAQYKELEARQATQL